MARAIWTGSISFGLVSIPVRLFSAVRDRSVHLNMLSDDGRCRLRRKMVCPETGKEYGFHEARRGYEIAPDQYVLIEEGEIDQIRPSAARTIDIKDFIEISEIDPIYFSRPYYMAPDERGARAYKLLLESLEESGKAALAKFVMHRKEYLALIRPKGSLLCLETMHYADEVVDPAEVPGIPGEDVAEPTKREMDIAFQLIDTMTADFHPEQYRDEYREQLLELIRQKSEGKEVVVHEPEPAEAAPVVDLMDALQKSLERKGERPTAARTSRRRSAGARTRKKKTA